MPPSQLRKIQRAGMLAMVTIEDETREELRLAIQSGTERYRNGSYKDKADARKRAAEVALILYLLLGRTIPKAQVRAASLGQIVALNELATILRFGGLQQLSDEMIRRAQAIVSATKQAIDDARTARRAPKPTIQDSPGGPYRKPGVSAQRANEAEGSIKDIVVDWRRKVDDGIFKRIEDGVPPNGAAGDAAGTLDTRVSTTIITEVSASTAEGHADAVDDAIKIIPKEVADTMLRRWDATLDNRTCDICASLDGRTIAVDDSWEVSPGSVHPRCRCFETLVRR